MRKSSFRWWVGLAVVTTALAAAARFAGCRPSGSAESFPRTEAESLRARLQPSDAALPLPPIQLVQSAWSTRAQWSYQTAESWAEYVPSVEQQLRPDFHLLARTATTVEFTRQAPGDAYHLRLEHAPGSPAATVNVTFTMTAD